VKIIDFDCSTPTTNNTKNFDGIAYTCVYRPYKNSLEELD
jgi:hypothetical protein